MSQSENKFLPLKNIDVPIAIIGMGRSGNAALAFLLQCGIDRSSILTFDDKIGNAQAHSVDSVLSFKPKTLVVSPGYPLSTPWIQTLKNQGVMVTSEINLASSVLTDEKIVGITGSLGKSTTTAALGAAALSFDENAFVGGNLGIPFCEYALKILKNPDLKAQWIILELSSFQLENSHSLKFDAAIITFLSANHMERYSSLETYYETKLNLIRQCQGPVVLNSNGGDLKKYFEGSDEFKNIPSIIWTHHEKWPSSYWPLAKMIGSHNYDNLSLGLEIIQYFRWPPTATEALMAYTGLKHRLEKVSKINGVLYINDSKATSLDSVDTGIQSCLNVTGLNRLHVLLGGRDKNLPWENLKKYKSNLQIQFYFFGESREKIKSISGLSGSIFGKMSEALMAAQNQAVPNDIVLLSPGGTSLDEFKNFEDRGDQFRQLVLK